MRTVGPSGKGWRGPAGAVLASLLFAVAVPLQGQPAPREANVRLVWQSGWTETGIAVAAGDILSIRPRAIRTSAEGGQRTPSIDPATGRTAGTQQQPERERDSLADTFLKAATRQVILGRVGEGAPFVVGRRYRQKVKAGGRLSLRWNVPRELAAGQRGFDVAIRVEPAPAVQAPADPPPRIDTANPANPPKPADPPKPRGPPRPADSPKPREPPRPADPPTSADPIVEQPGRDPVRPLDPEPAGGPAVENEIAAEPDADLGNASLDGQDFSPPAGPEPSAPTAPEATEIENRQTGPVLARSALIGGGAVAALLALAAAALALQRWRRRKLVERTRSLLALSPSLDLGEGACRGGGLPAGGPAASLRARLEEGAIRRVEGGENG